MIAKYSQNRSTNTNIDLMPVHTPTLWRDPAGVNLSIYRSAGSNGLLPFTCTVKIRPDGLELSSNPQHISPSLSCLQQLYHLEDNAYSSLTVSSVYGSSDLLPLAKPRSDGPLFRFTHAPTLTFSQYICDGCRHGTDTPIDYVSLAVNHHPRLKVLRMPKR